MEKKNQQIDELFLIYAIYFNSQLAAFTNSYRSIINNIWNAFDVSLLEYCCNHWRDLCWLENQSWLQSWSHCSSRFTRRYIRKTLYVSEERQISLYPVSTVDNQKSVKCQFVVLPYWPEYRTTLIIRRPVFSTLILQKKRLSAGW